jgi:hypothetical protein
MSISQSKFNLTPTYAIFLGNIADKENFMTGVNAIVEFRDAIPEQYGVGPVIDNMLKGIITKKESLIKNGTGNEQLLKEQIDYVRSKLLL